MAQRLFCKTCGWESPDTNIGMKNCCPECNDWLYIRTEDTNPLSSSPFTPDKPADLNSSLIWTDTKGHIHITEGSLDPRGVF